MTEQLEQWQQPYQREWVVVHDSEHVGGFRTIDGRVCWVKEVAVSIHANYLEALSRMAVEAMQNREYEYNVVEI